MAAQAYCSATTIKARIGITNATDDTLLGVIAGEVNSWLEKKIGFPVGPITSEERLFDGSVVTHGGLCLPVYPWGVRAVTAAKYRTQTGDSYTNLTTATDIFLRPQSHMRYTDWPAFEIWLSDQGTLATWPTYGFDAIGITATCGWAAIPSELSSIAIRLGVAMWRRRSSGSAQMAVSEDAIAAIAAEELMSSDWRTIWDYEGLRLVGAY